MKKTIHTGTHPNEAQKDILPRHGPESAAAASFEAASSQENVTPGEVPVDVRFAG